MVIGAGAMREKQDKQNKTKKKVEPPPKMIDPKLTKHVDFGQKPRNKKTYRFER